MDKLDFEILECLRHNSREKASAISRKINLSVSAVLERIHKMESQGVIRGYTVVTNKKMLGMGMLAVMEVSLEHPKYYDSFTGLINSMPEIVSCYYMTGDFDFILKIYAHDSDDLERIHKRIKSIHGVSSTRTYITLKTVKEEF
jgi:Lrp/AsnC family leucine-responsive transcriptional regulator